jgi:hypothetical protein
MLLHLQLRYFYCVKILVLFSVILSKDFIFFLQRICLEEPIVLCSENSNLSQPYAHSTFGLISNGEPNSECNRHLYVFIIDLIQRKIGFLSSVPLSLKLLVCA